MQVSGQLHAPAASYRKKSRRYPLDMRLSGTQNWSERYGEEKNLASPGNRTAAFRPVARLYTVIPPTIIILLRPVYFLLHFIFKWRSCIKTRNHFTYKYGKTATHVHVNLTRLNKYSDKRDFLLSHEDRTINLLHPQPEVTLTSDSCVVYKSIGLWFPFLASS
jgi:hypothetical protein